MPDFGEYTGDNPRKIHEYTPSQEATEAYHTTSAAMEDVSILDLAQQQANYNMNHEEGIRRNGTEIADEFTQSSTAQDIRQNTQHLSMTDTAAVSSCLVQDNMQEIGFEIDHQSSNQATYDTYDLSLSPEGIDSASLSPEARRELSNVQDTIRQSFADPNFCSNLRGENVLRSPDGKQVQSANGQQIFAGGNGSAPEVSQENLSQLSAPQSPAQTREQGVGLEM